MNASGLVERAFEWRLAGTEMASVLIVLTAAAHWAFRDRLKASWRFAIWLPVVARLLIQPLTFPESPTSIFNASRWFADTRVEAAQPPVSVTTAPMNGDFPSVEMPLDAEAPRSGLGARAGWGQIAAWVWLAGAGIFLGRLVLGSLWLAWRLRRARRPAEEIESMLRELAIQMGVRAPRLQATGMAGSPALFGLWRPRLLLPLDFAERFEPRALRHVFLHELAHLKRRDLYTNAVMNLAQALHWFNPLVWLALRQMRLEREIACDEAAIRAGGEESVSYGRTILLLLERASVSQPAFVGVGIAEEKFAAERRLREIAAFGRRSPSGWLAAAMAALLVCGGLTNAQPANQESRTLEAAGQPNASGARHLGAFPNAPAAGSARPAASSASRLLKLDQLMITNFLAPENARLADVLRSLDQAAKKADREGTGLSFLIHSRVEMQPAVDPLTGSPLTNERAENVQDYLVRLEDTPEKLRLRELVQRIAAAARPPAGEDPTNRLTLAMVNDGVVFMRRVALTEPLFTRTFKIDPNIFLEGIDAANLPDDVKQRTETLRESALRFFAAGGVRFETNAGPAQTQKAVFYNDRTGVLFVRAPLQDLDAIESMLHVISIAPPQVTFEVVAFAAADADQAEQLAKIAGVPSLTGILTDAQYRLVLRALAQNRSFRKVEFPRLTTLSGRPARSEVEGVGAVDMQVDVDGAVLSLRASITEAGAAVKAKLYDGQTLVFGSDGAVPWSGPPERHDGPHYIIFVTATIIDPAGNRVYDPAKLPFDPNRIPAQE